MTVSKKQNTRETIVVIDLTKHGCLHRLLPDYLAFDYISKASLGLSRHHQPDVVIKIETKVGLFSVATDMRNSTFGKISFTFEIRPASFLALTALSHSMVR